MPTGGAKTRRDPVPALRSHSTVGRSLSVPCHDPGSCPTRGLTQRVLPRHPLMKCSPLPASTSLPLPSSDTRITMSVGSQTPQSESHIQCLGYNPLMGRGSRQTLHPLPQRTSCSSGSNRNSSPLSYPQHCGPNNRPMARPHSVRQRRRAL